MHELLQLLEKFNFILSKQVSSFNEFIAILDQEEHAIKNYDLPEVEKSIILKDQHIRIAESLENQRVTILNKICYMIAFDARKQKVSLPIFKMVFQSYLENVTTLLPEDVIQQLKMFFTEFNKISEEFKQSFDSAAGRIYRNQLILKKVLKHVNLSLSLFQSAAEAGMNYNSLGQSKPAFPDQQNLSSVRVKV